MNLAERIDQAKKAGRHDEQAQTIEALRVHLQLLLARHETRAAQERIARPRR